jgi:hypothetical protein
VPVGFDVAQLPALPEPDEDLGGNPAPAPPGTDTPTPTPAATDATASAAPTPTTTPPASDIEFVDAPGAHAPTAQQRDAAKTLNIRR